MSTEGNPSRLFAWNPTSNAFSILDELGSPSVKIEDSNQPFDSSYFSVKNTLDDDGKPILRITVEDSMVDINVNTQVYYLMEYKPEAYVDYFNTDWQASNIFNGIHDIGTSESGKSQEYTILYETLNSVDHIWGRETLNFEDFWNLSVLDCPYETVYDRFENGYAAALRSKETITSKRSSVIISNYAEYKTAE